MDTSTIIAAWAAVAVSVSAIIGLILFWFRLGNQVGEIKGDADGARDKADAAERMAQSALAKGELVAGQLKDALIRIAEDYVTDKELAAAESRLASSVEGMRGDIRALTERLNRFIEHRN